MSVTQFLFWFLTALAVISALLVVISRNPVHSVLWLIATFFAISGHYIMLNAQFIGIVNLIVYAGAIIRCAAPAPVLAPARAATAPRPAAACARRHRRRHRDSCPCRLPRHRQAAASPRN